MPGSAIVILAATLNAVPTIPAIGLVLVLSVDWFIGMARAVGNLVGNLRRDGCDRRLGRKDLDRDKAIKVLDGEIAVDLTRGLNLKSRDSPGRLHAEREVRRQAAGRAPTEAGSGRVQCALCGPQTAISCAATT